MSASFDRRLHPVRPDLAARAYEGRVEAGRFAEGGERQVVRDCLDLRRDPRPDCGVDTQALFGETFTVFEETPEGWAWGQLGSDGYVGWVASDGLGDPVTPTHRVRALRSFRYPGADLRLPPVSLVSMGSEVSVVGQATTRGLDYALLADGTAMVAKHLVPLDHVEPDWVAVAEEFVGTPYLWAGRTSLGLDCSALIQVAARTGGHRLLRDSDMQEAGSGTLLGAGALETPRRGDLVFWKGHVAVITDPETILHANGYTMTVAYEGLKAALARIGANEFGEVTAVRRLP
ncbi:NlpC/P60 family protein [Roseibium aestuarii]|uniref:NlpC/P60 family protein n=1 Tax=Roseibium aestuarii TaxID=2600299 RepID=A0ABW4JVH9_9HYPH|nr:NlpC/P60 family protein [Roseibium aestuarii]